MPRKSHVDVGDDDVSNENVALLRTNDEEPFDDTQPLAGYNGRRISKRSIFGRIKRHLQTRKRTTLCAIILGLLFSFVGIGSYLYTLKPQTGQSPPWYPTPPGGTLSDSSWSESYKKAASLVNKMSLIEKVNITTGTGWAMGQCVGNTAPALEAGFPPLCLQDGPLGIRFAPNATAFPAGLTAAASFNRTLLRLRGTLHGLEARLKGVNVILGPAMGPLGRMPAGGRNWEGFGADPYLAGVAAGETVRGVQGEGVIATAKHFIFNEQEHFRRPDEWGLPNALSANVDDRTMHELYLWPFAESVRAGVGSVMCSYQMVNNSYACANSKILNGILKDELGFQGFVQSDWLAQRSGVASALAGLDMSMPGDGLWWANGLSLWGPHLTLSILNTSLPLSRLNDMTTRIVASYFQMHQDDPSLFPPPPPEGDGGPNFSSWTKERVGLVYFGSGEGETAVVNRFVDVQNASSSGGEWEGGPHGVLAREVAREGTVLLKNEGGVLPLKRDGPGSTEGAEGRKYKVGIFGEDAGEGEGRNACTDRGCNQGTLASGWGSGAVEFPYLITPASALQSAFNPSTVTITQTLTNTLSSSSSQATLAQQDLCIVFANADAGEGFLAVDGMRGDRNDLYVQKGGEELIKTVARGCGSARAEGRGKTVVVIHSVGAVVVEGWIEEVDALLYAHLPGQESGNALVDILFGDVNPSGKLPYTVGKSLEDYGEGGQILYYPNGAIPQQDFKERLYIDYRHFDKYNIEPRYEFGFGLSYTTFALSDLNVTATRPKSAFPSPRPSSIDPPSIDETIPPASSAVFPSNFRKIKKFVYSYIDKESDVKKGKYPYPDGYDIEQPLSQAGGGEGGNPSLWDIHASVQLTLTNTGRLHGQEVVQLYLSFPDDVYDSDGAHIDFPVKVLRGFEKVALAPGRAKRVTLELTRKDLSYWSVVHQNWVMPTEGRFVVRVGTSSRNLPLRGQF